MQKDRRWRSSLSSTMSFDSNHAARLHRPRCTRRHAVFVLTLQIQSGSRPATLVSAYDTTTQIIISTLLLHRSSYRRFQPSPSTLGPMHLPRIPCHANDKHWRFMSCMNVFLLQATWVIENGGVYRLTGMGAGPLKVTAAKALWQEATSSLSIGPWYLGTTTCILYAY